MTRIKRYNYEKHSILDIKKYLESQQMETDIKILRTGTKALWIKDKDVGIDLPFVDALGGIFADIRFEDYPKTENFEESKKIYEKLKRKFATNPEDQPKKYRLEQGEKPTNIKDYGLIEIIDFRK